VRAQYTGHFKAVITKPQNVLIMRDIACAGYVAGGNASFFTKNGKTHDLVTGRNAMQERLSFADDVGAKYGSMLAFPCTEQQFSGNQGLDTVMSVTSRLLPWEVTGVNARNHSSFPGGEQVYQAYNQALGLDSVHYGEDMKAAGLRHRLKPCPLATPADRPPASACLCREPGLHLPRQHKQRHVLPR
jgi:hypothetical protein